MTGPATGAEDAAELPNGPLLQSVGIAYRLCIFATAVLALVWLGSNIQRVPPDATAVVTRFGRVAEVHGAGLLLAWPEPIDRVVLLPGPQRQLGLAIAAAPPAAPPARVGTAGSYLTGDGAVVLLDAALTYRVVDPVAFMLAETHVDPALQRIFRAAAVAIAASHRLDDFLVVDQTRDAASRAGASARLRDALLAAINRRLQQDAALGIAATRLDLTAALPPAAKAAFDQVLTATQVADQGLADARTDATRELQQAESGRDRLLDDARAAAAERVSAAQAATATVAALSGESTPQTRANLLDQLYRSRIGSILGHIGRVTAVDPRGGPRVILSGGGP